MIRFSLAALLALSCFSCNFTTSGQAIDDHWNARSIAPRILRYATDYDAQQDGSYRDFQYNRKQELELTLRRQFLNHNPDNPYHDEVPSRFAPRPAHSILPNPWRYIHVEGILLGLAASTASGGFIPLPIDSFMGTIEEGGWSEFWGKMDDKLEDNEVVTASVPPSLGMEGEDIVISSVTQTSK